MSSTVILTGATGGLGLAIAERVLARPESFTCLFTVRNNNAPNAHQVHQLIALGSSNKKASTPELDLSNFNSVRAFAREVNQKVASGDLPPIRALILNAAIPIPKGDRKFTQYEGESLEMVFAVNYLGNFLLTLLLLDSLDKKHGRIVYVSSWTHDKTMPINQRHSPEKLPWDLEELAHPKKEPESLDQEADGMRRYGASKLCLTMFM